MEIVRAGTEITLRRRIRDESGNIEDLTGAALTLRYRLPNTATTTKAATIDTPATDGKTSVILDATEIPLTTDGVVEYTFEGTDGSAAAIGLNENFQFRVIPQL